MSFVLTQHSAVNCAHLGSVAVTGVSRLRVEGGNALRKDGIEGKAVTDCTTVPKSASGDPVDITCTAVAQAIPGPPAVSAGEATKLFLDGAPVMLDTLSGVTNGMVAETQPQNMPPPSAGHTRLASL
jgi:hypothetical protein